METVASTANIRSLDQALAKHAFVRKLDPQKLKLVAECATEVRFDPDQYLMHEGEEANEFYLILKGRVVLRSFIPEHHFTTIQAIGEDDIVGLSWLIPPHTWHFSAQAVQPTIALAVDGKRLRKRCQIDCELGYALLQQLAQVISERLRATRMRLR